MPQCGIDCDIDIDSVAPCWHSLSQVYLAQLQETASAYAASMPEPADGKAALLGWPDSAHLPPSCDLPVKDLGLSKKVMMRQQLHRTCLL